MRMVPCLYETGETLFTTNGIGKLADCVSCVVTEKRNGSFELEMEYPVDGIHAGSLMEGNIILAKPADNRDPQPFDIYKVSADLSGTVKVSARHISYRLNFITVSPTTVATGGYDQVNEAFKALVKNAGADCPFSFETDIESESYFGILEPMSMRCALGGADGSLLDTFGGEFEWDFFNVRFLKARGADNGVRIVYGKNLADFKQEKDSGDVITGVHPFWKDYETGDITELTEKVITLADTDVPYERIAVLDCSGEFDEEPTQAQLRSYAASHLEGTTQTEPSLDIEIDFEQLWQSPDYADVAEAERVALCDTVHVYVSTLGMEVEAKVTETEYDSLLERYKTITLSNAVAASRNSSLALALATTSQVRSLIAMTDSSIRLSVSNIYATKATLENNYSTTVETKSLIEASESAVTLSFEKKLADDYSTTAEIKSLISASEEGITLEYTKKLSGYTTTEEVQSLITASEEGIALTYTKNGEVRSQFAMEDSSITVKSGVITFESNSISIESDNFTLTTSGQVTAKGSFTSGSDTTYKMVMSSGQINGYYQGSSVGSITMKAYRSITIDGVSNVYRGVLVESEDIKLQGTLVDVNADYFSVNYASNSYYYGGTGTVTILTGCEWTSVTCVSDLSINFSSSKASWTNLTFSIPSSFTRQTIRFQ
ncbi:MAG: phage tail protein, partial [Clostridiales bacterium]|nr:phage tail protein [Clostridiales bacterium]